MPDFKPVYEGTPPLLTSMFVQSPRSQNLLDMLHYTLFPYCQYSSMTFVWMLLDIFVFCCCFWLDSIHKSPQLLKTSQKSLFFLGQTSPYHIVYEHHYFRLLTSLVLFRNLYHITSNLLCILAMGSYVEHIIGWKKTFLLVVLTGVAGELFGSIFNEKVSIEGATPVCGLVGYLLGICLLSWRKWERYSNQRFHMLVFLVVIIGVQIYSGLIYRNVNYVSQVAAMLYGFVYSLLENPETEEGRCSKLVKILAFLFIASTLTMMAIALLFWTYPSQLVV